MSTHAVVFPFDAFGSAGTAEGALLLGDVLREAQDDAQAEAEPTRPSAYTETLDIHEVEFDTLPKLADWRATGRGLLSAALKEGGFTVWLSGNHLGVLPVYDELTPADLVVQLDAHFDCFNLTDTSDELSHGNFLRHIDGPRPKILHVGSRDLFLPAKGVKPFVDAVRTADEIATDFAGVLKTVTAMAKKARRVWLDLDADAIDPAFAPAVHQPLPCGLTPQQLLALLHTLSTPKLVGLSVSEFDPGRDHRDTTLQLLAWFLERALLLRHE